MAGSSSSSSSVRVGVTEEYPYPSNLNATSFVSVKLSGEDLYNVWKTQMLCLLESHGMLGFIDGTFARPTIDRCETRVFKKKSAVDIKAKLELWRRSDALVKGWILGSLTSEVLKSVLYVLDARDFTAKDVWDKLQSLYSPVLPIHPPQQEIENSDSKHEEIASVAETRKESSQEGTVKEDKEKAHVKQWLYQCILERREYEVGEELLKGKRLAPTDAISINGNTALHVLVSTGDFIDVIEKLLYEIQRDTLLEMRNSEGSTVLHIAAIVGNIEAAKLLVAKNKNLLYAQDKEHHIPLEVALSNMHTEMVLYLIMETRPDVEKGSLFDGERGDELMVNAISSKRYDLARKLLGHRQRLNSDVTLMAIVQNFPSISGMWERRVVSWIDELPFKYVPGFRVILRDITILAKAFEGIYLLTFCCLGPLCFFYWAVCWGLKQLFQGITCRRSRKLRREFVNKIPHIVFSTRYAKKIKDSNDSSSYHLYYTDPVLEAARLDAYELVEKLVSHFPNAIWSENEDGHNIIQLAVINRSENVYNLLYQMSEHKNIYKTIKDSSENNLLHLAGRLAPSYKLSHISGAALQIQRELQWFQEVKRFVCPLNIIQKNSAKEAPEMVFTREHKDLVNEGEKWMKTAAESYTITAALITTVVFAAAITVPGGNNQDTGVPIFTKQSAFTVFAVSDAISLFTSATSLLMFLSVLTTRFAEQDFLVTLPRKLIIGLAMLFISTIAMMVAFSTTLFLVFGQNRAWLWGPIAVLACLPIASFMTLQFPLLADLIWSTYRPSIFGKRSNDPFY